ncbi:MAG: alpha/beta hydrolase [Sulfitobacter sp.]
MGGSVNAPDYRALIDAEMWAYIDRVDACYPPDAVDLDIAGQRDVYDAMCRVFYQGRPDSVGVQDEVLGGVPCRRYEVGSSDVTVVYYHGGGFVVGGLDSHDDVCAEICARTGYRVISVDYGLAPEVVYPGCFNDAWAAFRAISDTHNSNIILAGDSAGGNLAAAVSHHARGRVDGRIVGQVLIYPGLGGDWNTHSYVRHANAPHLTTTDMKFYMTARTGGAVPPQGDPCYAPLQDSDFTALPPTVCVTAECDPLSSDGGAYRDAIVAAGGQAVWINAPGMVHGCLRARAMSARAASFFDEVVKGIKAVGQGDWPYTLPS